jgi:hypothetical protein
MLGGILISPGRTFRPAAASEEDSFLYPCRTDIQVRKSKVKGISSIKIKEGG